MDIGAIIMKLMEGRGGSPAPAPSGLDSQVERYKQDLITKGAPEANAAQLAEVYRQKMMASDPAAAPAGGVPPPAGDAVPVPPPRPEVPTGATPPGATPPPAAPPPAPPIPEAYKSPPDLATMYMELFQKGQKQAAIMRGATLVAAGFAQDQNRPALIEMAKSMGGGSSGSGAGAPSMEQLINMQKMQQAEQERTIQRQQLPAIMEQYGLSKETAAYLDSTGQLDDTLSTLTTKDTPTEIATASDGSQKLINSSTGETIKELSGAKARETEYVGPEDGEKILVYKDDKTRVDTGERISAIPAKTMPITVTQLADGRQQAVQNGMPVGEPWGPETKVTTDDITEWQVINEAKPLAERESLDDWILRRTAAGTEAGQLRNDDLWGKPPADQAWKRDPKTMQVEMDENGAPIAVYIKGTKGYDEHQKAVAEAEKAATEAADAAEKATSVDTRDTVKNSIQGQNIDRALEMLHSNKDAWIGVGGVANSALNPMSWLASTDQGEFKQLIYNIGTNIGLKELQGLRDASPTGASGLGSVTESEHRMIQQVLGVLDPSSKPEVLELNLRRIQKGMDLIANGIYDPSSPKANDLGYRAPTEADISAAMAKVKQEVTNPSTTEIKGLPGYTLRPVGGSNAKPDPNALVPTGN